VKSVLYGDKITPLIDKLPSLRCRVRFAHTATQTPRKKMANAIILLFPTRWGKQGEATMEICSELKKKMNVVESWHIFCTFVV